ncbi:MULTISPECIES: class I SAM-dependent methyltransferase [unclassified Hydrogenophaga]|uniref:class I SAM-dependent methyltransferase n=1 Tax=unclassified Hydrogenophaga TaxID=2610897 RepID=UPI0026268812|nr:class I SAM-dependent methyltransferase [Hydrogenophaga sp.]MCW5671165.1 class I SAM-dependent methyltransferase [Hydrogenophaga sp.]
MNPSITDGQAFKAGMRIQWDTAAAGWNAHTTDIRAWLRKPTDAMCRMAGVTVGSRVLDVAAGAGDQALDIAAQVGPQGHVLATDLSPAIVALAQVNAVNAGFGHVETRVADGEDLGVTEASFDVAVCRLGLMFFPDPLRGLREIHRALRPGGGVCTMVFSRPEKNPCLTILMSTALKHAGLPARDPFLPGGLLSLGQPGRIDALFKSAGFQSVATMAFDAVFHLPSVDHYLAFVRSSASPLLQLLGHLDAASAEAAWDEMRDRLQAFTTQAGWDGSQRAAVDGGSSSRGGAI